MQQLAKDEQGNVWDTSTNPPRLVQAAGGGQSQTVGTPDPRVAQERVAKDLAIQAAMRSAARDPVKDQREDAKARREELEWNATHNSDGSPKPQANKNGSAELTAATRASAINAFTATRQLDSLISDIEKKYQAGPGSTHGVAGIQDYLPTPSNRRFDAAGNAVRGAAITALGFTSGQTNTPREVEQNIGPYIPAAGDYDEVITDKLARLKELRDRARVQAVTVLGGVPDASGKITPLGQLPQQDRDQLFPPGTLQPFNPGGPGGAPPPSPGGGSPAMSPPGAPRKLAADEMVHFNGDATPVTGKRMTPQQEGEITAAIRSGDEGQAVALLGRYGPGPVGPGEVASIRATIAQVRKNPSTPVSFNYGKVDSYAQTEADRKRFGDNLPQAMDERSKAGGLDVSVRSGTNGLTAGLADYLAAAGGMVNGRSFSDNLKRQKALSEADARLHPNNTMVSGIVGGAAGAALTEGATRALLPARMATTWAPRLADAAYGTVAGATGAAPGEGASGAVKGALSGFAGGAVGRGAMRTAAGAVGGVRNAAIDELRTRGIPLTVGQALSQSGRVGQVAKSVEDAMTSIPVIGSMINARRAEGLRGFNRAALDEALAPIGETAAGTAAEDGVARARGLVSQAYDNALTGVRMTGDAPFVNDMQGVFGRAGRLPATMADNAEYTLNTRVGESFGPQGDLTGNAYQQSLRGLRRDAAAVRNQPYGHDFGQITQGAEQALEGLASRQAPEVIPALGRANEAYGRVGILRDAVNAARNGARSGEGGVFMPSQLADAASRNARRFGGTQATPDAPFFQLNEAARDVLPSRIPDSGSVGRLFTGMALTGGAAGSADYASGADGKVSASTAGTLALLAALGTRRGQQALVAGLSRRPDAVRAFAERIAQQQRLVGAIGVGGAVPLLADR